MATATVEDVSVRLGRSPESTEETAQWGAWLDDVETIIVSRLGAIEALTALGTPTAATLKMVEANVVIRKINNPTGKRSERIDDYYYELGTTSSAGDLSLTDTEWDLLTPSGSDTAFTIVPGGRRDQQGEWVHPDVWVPYP